VLDEERDALVEQLVADVRAALVDLETIWASTPCARRYAAVPRVAMSENPSPGELARNGHDGRLVAVVAR
jgi:hypothetical protein